MAIKKKVQAPQFQVPQQQNQSITNPYAYQWAMQGNDQALLGMLLGKLLRQGFDTWKDNYDARGAAKRDGGNIADEQSGADATSIYSQPSAQPSTNDINFYPQYSAQPNPADNFRTDLFFGNDEYTTLPSFDGLPMIGR